jgi:hypothetical protein
MNVVNKLITIAIVVWLFTGIGCKEPVEQPVEDNISGVYKVYAKVTKRPKIFEPEYAPSWAIQMHGVWIDTTENICCGDRVGKIKNCCPDEYVMDNFEIYLQDGIYFIRNKTTYDADSNRLTWDIPLIKRGDDFVINFDEIESKRFLRSSSEYDHWTFHFLDYRFNSSYKSGSMTILDGSCTDYIYSCFNTADNKTYRYGMGELADLRFEKVE